MTEPTLPNFDKTDDDIESPASFTSWKLRVMNAISMDRRVSHGEFRVAFRLLQHANSQTGAIFPSQETIADQIGVRVRQVRDYIAGLVDKGWLMAARPNRQKSNRYAFDLRHENAVLDRQISLADDRAERRKITSQKFLTGEKPPLPRGEKLPLPRGEIPPLNTLREHPQGTPESGLGIERDVGESLREAG